MNRFIFSVFNFALILLASCSENQQIEEEKESVIPAKYGELGDSITRLAQQTLLSKLSNALEIGGPVNAIKFCNVSAIPLTDSISMHCGATISRISEKYRNPMNKPSDKDRSILQFLSSSPKQDTLISKDGTITYYKSIRIGMPLCIQCHGEPIKDIELATLQVLDNYYEDDMAIDYTVGDFRGAWKVVFDK